jgi:hypothetical protein
VFVYELRVTVNLLDESCELPVVLQLQQDRHRALVVPTKGERVAHHLTILDRLRDFVRDKAQLDRVVRTLRRLVDRNHPPSVGIRFPDEKALERILSRDPSLVDVAAVGRKYALKIGHDAVEILDMGWRADRTISVKDKQVKL